MRPETCMICNDKRKFQSEVYQAKNIVHRLTILAKNNTPSEFNNMEKQLLFQLKAFGRHPHFMCGTCSRVNMMDLKNLEDKIDILLVMLTEDIDINGQKYHDILRLLRGAYSGKCKTFEQYCHRRTIKQIV